MLHWYAPLQSTGSICPGGPVNKSSTIPEPRKIAMLHVCEDLEFAGASLMRLEEYTTKNNLTKKNKRIDKKTVVQLDMVHF
jgi:hypothetical protein